MMQEQETVKVGDYMTRNPVSLPNTSSLQDAIDTMAKKGIGNLVVTDGASIGILTEREILNYLNLFGAIPDRLLGDIMLRQFTKVSPETPIAEAARKMLSTRTRLLVYEDDKLAGIITTSDLAGALFKTTETNPSLERVMSRNVVSLESYASILEAIRMMDKKRIGSIVVTVEGLHDGIFTERDLLTKILTRNVDLAQEIGNYSSQFLVTARMGIGARDAAKLMFANGIKRLPIASSGRIVGMVTARDVVEAFITNVNVESTGCDPVC
jgi:predicted transcriptional regulator